VSHKKNSVQPRGLEWEEVEPWVEAVQLDLLLDELTREISRFVVLPKWGAEMLSLWVVWRPLTPFREFSTV
jgi:hypothetical protein